MRRRTLLRAVGAGAAALLLPWPAGLGPGLRRALAASLPRPAPLPECRGSLDDLLFVYDQCTSPQFLREMVAILRHAPPGARRRALVSRTLADAARAVLAGQGLDGVEVTVADTATLTNSWGCDLLQLGRGADGGRVVHVPWTKSADTREDLARGWRELQGLAGDDLRVQLLPVAAEGGNLIPDLAPGDPAHPVLFAGGTVAVETRALYRAWYGTDPGDDGVARVLGEALGVDDVVWIGPRADGDVGRQSPLLFHVDMGMTVVAPGVAVVAACDPGSLDPTAHLALLEEEAARTIEALDRRAAAGIPWPAGLDLPRQAGERGPYLEARRAWERDALDQAAAEMEQMADALTARGYAVHRLPAAPERVRRFQSHTNVIAARDRLVMPLFPTRERVHGWVLHRDGRRDVVDVDLGLQDSDFALDGDNLAAYRLYRSLHEGVRAVRDYFYLACGNVHCVIGRLD